MCINRWNTTKVFRVPKPFVGLVRESSQCLHLKLYLATNLIPYPKLCWLYMYSIAFNLSCLQTTKGGERLVLEAITCEHSVFWTFLGKEYFRSLCGNIGPTQGHESLTKESWISHICVIRNWSGRTYIM